MMRTFGVEDQTTEYKSELNDKFEKEVVAFLNSDKGGDIFILKKFGQSPAGCYMRVGSGVQQMTVTMIDRLYASRVRNSLRNIPAPTNRKLSFLRISDHFFELCFPYEQAAEQAKAIRPTEIKGEAPEKSAGDFGLIAERIRKEFGSGLVRSLEIIYKHPDFSAEEIAAALGKTPRTVENHIAKLKKGGFITRKGPKLGGHWEVL